MSTKKKPSSNNKKGARLGQHFLTASSIADTVARSARVAKDTIVLEIGPGKGMLTRSLLALGARVIAVEKDPELVDYLAREFRDAVADNQLTVVHADIRSVTSQELGLKPHAYALAANIPYYITGEIVRMFLTSDIQPHSMALLIQKEVAERIARSKKESLLSLSVKVYGTPHYVQTVRAGSFSPPPAVDSAILAVTDISRNAFTMCTEDTFFATIRAGFASKRKLLLSNLTTIAQKDTIHKAFGACAIDEKARAEDVPLEKWLCLAGEL
jgi:16S rRNA (adenine1518-N6/adenine1519-N6)-dimethyltransferase